MPVDGETSLTAALQDKDASRGEKELPPKSSDSVTLHNDDDDAASPLDDEPGRAASQRSSGQRGDEEKPDANEGRAAARTLVLKGHTANVMCLAALDGGRLASASWDQSVIVWSLVDGTQIAKLEGHSRGVNCLAALTDNRLASGSDDKSIIIWNVADGTQLAKLGRHTGGIWSLAALDGGRLASSSGDKSVIIWNVADGTRLAKLKGHTDPVQCLAALDGNRFASGGGDLEKRNGGDTAIRIWNVADGTLLAKLEGHTAQVLCLAALDGGRLASGGGNFEKENGGDTAIRIWNLADGTLFAKLEGHTAEVFSLAALDGGRLASCGRDNTIRIWNVAVDAKDGEAPYNNGEALTVMWGQKGGISAEPQDACQRLAALDDGRLASGDSEGTIRIRSVRDSSAALRIAECGSAFEFEEVARECRENNALEELFDAVDHHALYDKDKRGFGKPRDATTSSGAIATQAHVFDAIAKVVNEEKDPSKTSKALESLTSKVFDLVRDDKLLSDMTRRGVSNAAIQELAPSTLFRVVLDAKFAAGPVFVLYFELFLFVVLGACFTRIASFEVLDVSKWFGAEKILEIVVAFVILAYFSARELYQMWSTRAIELEQPENLLEDEYGDLKVKGLALWALLIPRLLVGFMVCLPFLPVWLVRFGLARAGKEYAWMEALEFEPDSWFTKAIFHPILHDPLTFLGLSKAWRYDYWNIIDAATIGCGLAAFARAAMPGGRLSADLAVATSLLMWIRFCWYLKNMRLGWAKFVLMIEQIVRDLKEYLLFFLVILMAFASAFYLYLGPREHNSFDFFGGHNAFRNFGYTMYNLILLGFVGDFDADNFDEVIVRVLLVFFIFVVIVVLLNVLIAIVSDSYDLSMAKAEALYYRSRLELITETAPIASRLPKWMLPDYNAHEKDWDGNISVKHARLHKMITEALDDAKKDKSDDPNRLNYTINAIEAIVDNRTRKLEAELAATREKIDNLTVMIQKLLDKEQS